jgi:hypothetical protein
MKFKNWYSRCSLFSLAYTVEELRLQIYWREHVFLQVVPLVSSFVDEDPVSDLSGGWTPMLSFVTTRLPAFC